MTMHIVARIVLGAMFALAAITKLRDPDGRRSAVIAFGVPASLAGPAAVALIGAEAAVVGALVVAPPAGAIAAGALLVIFGLAIGAQLARGRSPQCHCFGRLSSGPVGWSSVARNAAFAILAVFIAIDGGYGWLLGAALLVATLLWLGPGWKRLWAGQIGAPAPDFLLDDTVGRPVSLVRLLEPGRPVVLVFGQTGCAACEALLPDIARWQDELADQVTVALINGGPTSHRGAGPTLVDESRRVLAAYRVTGTPSAVLIDRDKRLVGAAAQGAKAIHELIDQVVGVNLTRRRAAIGIASAAMLPGFSALLAAVGAPGTKAAAAPALENDALEVDGAWLCNQTFALCTTAPCVPSPTDPGVSICQCVVQNGYSIGFKSCTDRAQSGLELTSDFSTVNVNPAFGVLTCPSGVPWANCLDMPCEIDPVNPALANCQCRVVNTGVSLTFGGGCNPATCTETIWSAATPDLPGSTQYTKGMKQLNQPVTFPQTCPTN